MAVVEDLRKFSPAPLLSNGHLMTLAPLAIWRRFPLTDRGGEKIIIEVDQENKVSVCVHLAGKQPLSEHVIMLLHGLESSAEAAYVKGVCEKALAVGFSVVRVNLRNCGNTLHLSKGLYNAGLSGDVLAIAGELQRRGFKHIYACGFSLGGNIVLKAAGENGLSGNNLIDGFCAVSPPADLDNCVRAIESGANRIYEQNFLVSLKRKVLDKDRLYPGRYPVDKLKSIKTLRHFDDTFTAPDAGYGGASAYYQGASARRVIAHIKQPTLIVTAKDDPLVPFDTFESEEIAANEAVTLLGPECGGHVGFVAERGLHADDILARFGRKSEIPGPRDKFWAEWQIVDFFLGLAEKSLS